MRPQRTAQMRPLSGERLLPGGTSRHYGKVSGESAYIGRTYGDAPKVDGYIFVQTGELLVTGDFAKVTVTGALEYDLIGELADEYTE